MIEPKIRPSRHFFDSPLLRTSVVLLVSLVLSTDVSVSAPKQTQSGTASRGIASAPSKSSVAASALELPQLLDLDRFTFYLSKLSATVQKKNPEAAAALSKITPEEVVALLPSTGHTLADLSKAENYDDIAIKLLRKSRPEVSFEDEQLRWNYNFLKRKLNEAFVIKPKAAEKPTFHYPDLISRPTPGTLPQSFDVPPGLAADVTLSVDGYAADRTSRAVFWDAAIHNRPMEFHVGNALEFRESLAARGGEILSEISPPARNYNPIYLIQLPGESQPRYAITELSGIDRLDHMVRHLDLVRWNGKSAREQMPVVEVFGGASTKIARDTDALTSQLRRLPKADRVVIGQKGALESALSTSAKAAAAIDFIRTNPQIANERLTPAEIKILTKQAELGETRTAFKKSSDWERIFEKLNEASGNQLSEKTKLQSISIENASHSLTDILVETNEGKKIRYRLISNVWGDEIVPIAEALKRSGHHEIIYAGTAGALPGSKLSVGDLLIPDSVLTSEGKKAPLSDPVFSIAGSRTGGAVAHVGTPYEETFDWLAETQKKAAAVELETGYLGEVFNDPKKHKVQINLLISDVVGSEGETLDAASSADRRKSLDRFLETLLAHDGVTRPVVQPPVASAETSISQTVTVVRNAAGEQITRWLKEAYPNRDPASLYQLRQTLSSKFIPDRSDSTITLKRSEILAAASQPKSFTTSRLGTTLEKAGELLTHFQKLAHERGIRPELAIDTSLLDGKFNPATDKLKAAWIIQDEKLSLELEGLLREMEKRIPEAKKLFQFSVIRGPPSSPDLTLLPESALSNDRRFLADLYQSAALANAGYSPGVTRTGAMKLVHIPTFLPADECVVPGPQCGLAHFKPDAATQEVFDRLPKNPSIKSGLTYLKSLAAKYKRENKSYGFDEDSKLYKENATVAAVIEQVDSLPDGELAKIQHKLRPNGHIDIVLKITDEGLRSPVVLLEEGIHLEQIFDMNFPGSPSAHDEFVELVFNAEAGSLRARAALAAIEEKAQSRAHLILSGTAAPFPLPDSLLDQKESVLDYFQKRTAHAEREYKAAHDASLADQKKQTKKWEARKPKLKELEALPEKLNDLVAKNDRAGAAALIREYLPWEIMEPSEIRYWETALDSIQNPNPAKEKLFFRGLDEYDRRVFTNNSDSLFSTLLSRNQGNYTRRLRSFATKKTSFQSPVNSHIIMADPSIETWASGSIRHSADPKASPYLSLTRNPSTARNWDGAGIVAVKIDSTRIIPNWVSRYPSETEHLAPLLVFPEEVVAKRIYPIGDPAFSREAVRDEFFKEVQEKTGISIETLKSRIGFNDAELITPYEILGADYSTSSSPEAQIRACLTEAFRKYR